MKDPQEIFNELKEQEAEKKEIQKTYKNALAQDSRYQEILEELDALRAEKKEIERAIQAELGSSWTRAEELKELIKDSKQILTDVVLTNIMEGKTVEVRDQWDTLYEPVHKITFKKAK